MHKMSRSELLRAADRNRPPQISHHPIKIIILAVSALIAVTGFLSSWSPGDIVLTIILGVAFALWGYYGFLRIQQLRYPPASGEKWSRVQKFKRPYAVGVLVLLCVALATAGIFN